MTDRLSPARVAWCREMICNGNCMTGDLEQAEATFDAMVAELERLQALRDACCKYIKILPSGPDVSGEGLKVIAGATLAATEAGKETE